MLARKTPLKRGGAIRPKPPRAKTLKPSKLPEAPKRSKSGPPRDAVFLAFVRTMPCLVPGCCQPSEAHHFGKRGKSQKCSDYETAPLCHEHHMQWHTSPQGLPGGDHSEWKRRFSEAAAKLVALFFGL